MKTQKTTHKMKRPVYSGSLALTLATIVAAAMFALPRAAWSQTAEWTVYNTSNSGLPYNTIGYPLAIDAQGNVWIGTGDHLGRGGGLAKFDGENWTVYTTGNSGLPCNNLWTLAFDAQDNLWIGTCNWHGGGGGLAKFDGENWTVYTTENSGLPDKDVIALAFDPQGSLWVGTYGGGLAKFDGENWTVYNSANSGLPYNIVWALAFDAQGNVWIGTTASTCGVEGGGLAKFDGENWTVYNKANSGLTSNDVWALAFDAQGNLWAGTGDDEHPEGGGLAKFDGVNWTVYHTSNSPLTWHMVLSLAFDAQENLWMGMWSSHTTTGGLAKFDGENWWVFNTWNSGLPHVTGAVGLAFDAQGNLWIATYGGGLAVYRQLVIVDLNGDEKVDFKDFTMLAQYWYQDQSPFLNRMMDYKDLAVLADYWLKELLPVGLIAYWKLDETEGGVAHDSIGGEDAFGPPDLLWRPEGGKVAGALELDGIDDLLYTTFSLNPADTSFSVFAWIKGSTPGQVIIGQANGANWLAADSSEGLLITDLKGTGRFGSSLGSQTVITDDNWHRVGLTWDGSTRILYVDNVEVAKDTQPGLVGSTGGLYFGAGEDLDAASFFSGLIDDIRIYDRAVIP